MIDIKPVKVFLFMKKFFLSSAVAMLIISFIVLIASLPKEILILSVHGLILSLIGFFINDIAIGKIRGG